MGSAHGRDFRICDFDSDAWLSNLQGERAVKVCAKRTRRGQAVREPPSFSTFDLRGRAARDAQSQWHRLPQAVQPGK